MGIEDLRTKADLETFIEERLQQMPTTVIRGLPEALAARYAQQFPQTGAESIELTGTPIVLTGATFEATANMTVLALGQFDLEGPSIAWIALNGVVQDPEATKTGVTGRETVCTFKPLILSKGDVVDLRAVEYAAPAIAWSKHTALTIVRLS